MTNKEIARALQETAALIELTGGNPFRGRAFSSGARALSRLDEPATDLLKAGTLTEIQGIGKGLAAQIEEFVQTGSFGLRDELLSQIPPGLSVLLRVKGLGVKRIRQLWQELGITSLDSLEAAARQGQLASVAGFGVKTQEKVLANIQVLRKYLGRRRYASAVMDVEPILRVLRNADAVVRAETTGPLRRQLETVGRADLIVAGEAPDAVRSALSPLLGPDEPSATSDDVITTFLAGDFELRVHVVPAARFGTAWWETTGSDAHVQQFVERYGAPSDHEEESALYSEAGLSFVPPELREGTGELETAASGTLPTLLTVDDLRGTLHNHSTYSDGAHSLKEMADEALAMGLEYFGVCDHSQSLTIAGGLTPREVEQQQAEIRSLNELYERRDGPPFRIFSGIECDILADGSLDFSEDVLASFDFVVASVHSGFSMTEDEATRRIIRAVEHPRTTILGHATGRLLLSREGYPLDHERVIAACAANGVAIELNANPRRLDMDWRWIRYATDRGVLIAINPDAHSTQELHNVEWGVAVARKGWLTPDQCLNAMPLPAFTDWLAGRTGEGAVP